MFLLWQIWYGSSLCNVSIGQMQYKYGQWLMLCRPLEECIIHMFWNHLRSGMLFLDNSYKLQYLAQFYVWFKTNQNMWKRSSGPCFDSDSLDNWEDLSQTFTHVNCNWIIWNIEDEKIQYWTISLLSCIDIIHLYGDLFNCFCNNLWAGLVHIQSLIIVYLFYVFSHLLFAREGVVVTRHISHDGLLIGPQRA